MTTCPICQASDSTVYDNRQVHRTIRRRRRCHACGHQWVTFEVTAEAYTTLSELEAFHARLAAGRPDQPAGA